MYTRHGVVVKYDVSLPEICAWCGQRSGRGLHPIQIHYGGLLSYVRYSMTLPICSECERYVKAYLAAKLRFTIHLTIMLLPLALGLIYVLLQPLNHLFAWVSWFVLGGGSAWLIAKWALAQLLQQRHVEQIVASMTGSPPTGYTGWGGDPAQLTQRGSLCFSSRDFQRAFAALNPDLSLCAGNNTVCQHS